MSQSPIQLFRLNNLTGGINSISEEDALISFGGQAEARDIENFLPLNRGGQSKCYGYTLFYHAGASPITGLYQFTQSNGNVFFLYSMGTLVYKLVSGTATSIGASIGNGALTHFETAFDKCIICDGVSAPVFWDGSSITTIANGAPVGARQSLFYQNRLWIFGGTANPSLLYYSTANDITTGYTGETGDGGFVQCDTNDGQTIVSIGSYFIPGQLAPVLFVGKQRSVGLIQGDGSSGNPYTYIRINQDFGVPGFRQNVQFGDRLAYLTPTGVAAYAIGQPFQNLEYQYLSEKVRNNFQALNASTLSNALCWHDWRQTRISWAVPESGYTWANVIYHYDYRLNCWYKERGPGNIVSAYIDPGGNWYHGDDLGNIYLHGPDYTSFNNSAINAYYMTPYLDFGDPLRRKRIVDAKIAVRTQGAYSVGISNTQDYGIRVCRSNVITGTTGNFTWDGGTWNNTNVYSWGQAPITIKRFFPSGWFRTIQLTLTQNGLNQPLDVFEIEFAVEFSSDP